LAVQRAALLIIIGLLAAAAAGAWWWLAHRMPSPVAWQGYAEADYVKVGPVEAGQLTAVFVARGDQVKAEQPLFTQDETEERAARDQAARQYLQAQQQLANLEAGGKPTEIQQAEANLADARANVSRAQTDLRRAELQFPIGGVSAETVDDLRAGYQSAQARMHAAEAALAQLHAPLGRERELDAQRAAVEAAQAALQMAQWRLDQRSVAAPVAARVADVIARPGETMAAGAPVVSLLPPENIFVRFFVPEAALARIHRGDQVALSCDACPADLTATISFVAPQAEYTPPVIYSEESRAKLVYLIEARPPRERAALLNPGQPIMVRPLNGR
jgi:HlyD family secretion protein